MFHPRALLTAALDRIADAIDPPSPAPARKAPRAKPAPRATAQPAPAPLSCPDVSFDANGDPVFSEAQIAIWRAHRDRNTIGGNSKNTGKWRVIDRRKAWQKELTDWTFDKSGTVATSRRHKDG